MLRVIKGGSRGEGQCCLDVKSRQDSLIGLHIHEPYRWELYTKEAEKHKVKQILWLALKRKAYEGGASAFFTK